jgi:hypothetical protein
MSDETPLQKLNDELKEAHVDPSVTVEHDITKDDTLTVVVDPIKESEDVALRFKI